MRGQIAFEFLLGLNAMLLIVLVLFLLISSILSYSSQHDEWVSKTVACESISYAISEANLMGTSQDFRVYWPWRSEDNKFVNLSGYMCRLPGDDVSFENQSYSAGTYYFEKNGGKIILRSR